MKKKLTAKIQQLNPVLPQYGGSFSRCVVIEPEDKEIVLRKGSVYAIVEIQGDASFDTELIYKVTQDIIHNSYYQSENISPIQSMEKTILEVRDKIIQLSSDVLRSDQQAVKLNIVSTVLWGNVLYTVQYGDMSGFIMEEGTIKPITMISEGSFSASSQVVDNDNVIILCTENFKKELPPEKLLSSSVSDQSLKPNQTCLLMKLVVDTSLSEEETIDFGLEKAISKAKSKTLAENISGRLSIISTAIKNFFGKFIKNKVPKVHLPKFQKRSSIAPSNFKFKLWMIAPVVVTLVIILITPKIFKNSQSKQKNADFPTESTDSSAANDQKIKEEADRLALLEKQKADDEKYKVQRVKPETFYDIKITNSEAEPTDIAVFIDKIVVVDKASGKIFVSATETPKFTEMPETYPGIRSVVNSDGMLNFLDNTGFKIYNLVTSKMSETQDITAELAFPYSGYIYALSEDTIRKYKDDKTAANVWGQEEDFRNTKSMAIAFNIYLLSQKNELLSFTAGDKVEFYVTGLESGFSDAVKLVADVDFKNIYVADKGNKSIVVLDNKGSLIKQYKTENNEDWDDLKSISISPDEKTLYVLSGSKVFKVNL